jgi:hypothetical protein
MSASLIGLVQYMVGGAVSIRPGREPVVGPAAVEQLAALAVISAGFAAMGMFLRWRAKRHATTRRD